MQPPDPSSLAALLVEEHGKSAYARAVVNLVNRQEAGDQAGERLYLQVVMIVQQLLQESVLSHGQIPNHVSPTRQYPVFPVLDLPDLVEKLSDGIPLPPEPSVPIRH